LAFLNDVTNFHKNTVEIDLKLKFWSEKLVAELLFLVAHWVSSAAFGSAFSRGRIAVFGGRILQIRMR